MRILFHILLFIFFFQTVFAQELPFNSQIFVNPYYYNPAYAGFEDRPAFYVYRRQQWTGIEGAPVTTGFNFHTIFNEKINFGVHIMSDKRSILNTTRALVTFGYRASFDDYHYISFGLSGGIGFNTIDLDAIDPDDPAIIDALDNNMFLDGNAGFNYYNKGFNLGLSLPKIFKTNTISNSEFVTGEISPLNDAIFMTSYKWEISEEKFAIEPYGIYYYSKDFQSQFEAIGLIHLMDVFWIGASYRQDYGTTGFVGLNIKDNFKFGYAYEFFNVQPNEFSNGTHDIQLALVFGEKKKKGKVNLIQKRRNMLRSMGKLPSEQN
ncbi:MAG: PorP/SprF family type IX secretion system membrane protein, partial [Cyclobacteriaceae bacterium]|nr:PorP/SprF family type IX secretion system membrane protein [Cyclobacteriaceae bacterium]